MLRESDACGAHYPVVTRESSTAEATTLYQVQNCPEYLALL